MHYFSATHGRLSTLTRLGILTLVSMAMIAACVAPSQVVPADETKTGITLEEAQTLAPFSICLPAWFPDSVNPNMRITYHTDFGDPMDSDIQLDYFWQDKEEVAVYVTENYWPNANKYYAITPTIEETAYRDILAWMVGWTHWQEQGKLAQAEFSRDNEMKQMLILEIVYPPNLQSTLIEWPGKQVLYRVFTRLSLQDARQIVETMRQCP